MEFAITYIWDYEAIVLDENNEEGVGCKLRFERSTTIRFNPAGLDFIWFTPKHCFSISDVSWEVHEGRFVCFLSEEMQDDKIGVRHYATELESLKQKARKRAEKCGFALVFDKTS